MHFARLRFLLPIPRLAADHGRMPRAALLVVFAALAVGCSNKSSGGSSGPSFDASADGPVFDASMEDAETGTCEPPVSAACTACLSSHCGSPSGSAQSACAPVISCYCACQLGDACCVQACGPDVTSSCVSSAAALAACATQSCASECTVTSPGSCTNDAGAPDAAEAAAGDAGADGSADAGADASPVACTGDGGVSTLWTESFKSPFGIAVDSTSVYWLTTNQVNAVVTAPLCGGTPTTIATFPQTVAYLAVAGGVAYFSVPVPGLIMSVPVAGGTPSTFGHDVNGTTQMIVVDQSNVYWADTNSPQGGGIVSEPIGGGAQTTLVTGDGPVALAQDATNLYWVVESNMGVVKKIAKTGGTPVTLATGQSYPIWVATDGTNVYWDTLGATVGTGTLAMVPVDGGTPTTLATQQSEPYGIVVDSTDIYWAEPGVSQVPGAVVTVPIAGGTPTTLVTGENYPELLAVTPTTLYWTEQGSSSVMALTPK